MQTFAPNLLPSYTMHTPLSTSTLVQPTTPKHGVEIRTGVRGNLLSYQVWNKGRILVSHATSYGSPVWLRKAVMEKEIASYGILRA